MAGHNIVHVEIPAHDPEKAGEFYQRLFGWETQAVPEHDYAFFRVEPGPGGGFPKVDGVTFKAGDVVVYVGTDDIDATLRRAEQLGAKTLLGKTEAPGFGWYAFFSDPTGNRIALWTDAPKVA